MVIRIQRVTRFVDVIIDDLTVIIIRFHTFVSVRLIRYVQVFHQIIYRFVFVQLMNLVRDVYFQVFDANKIKIGHVIIMIDAFHTMKKMFYLRRNLSVFVQEIWQVANTKIILSFQKNPLLCILFRQ